MTYFSSAEEHTELPAAQLRRRYQQKKCLVCGAKNRATPWALFCASHSATHRYCSLCETVVATPDYGSDRSRCRLCSKRRALDHYYADPDRSKYRIRLRQMAGRQGTRGDQVFANIRRRIALAELVRRTPDMSWTERGRMVGRYGPQLASDYRHQCAGTVRDVDTPDRVKRKRGGL
jgi:anaerobic selenocysteine-containing dehydrogenase